MKSIAPSARRAIDALVFAMGMALCVLSAGKFLQARQRKFRDVVHQARDIF